MLVLSAIKAEKPKLSSAYLIKNSAMKTYGGPEA
jgi:hypothetical protein